MGRRYKKWSELSFWERMYIDEAAYESARFDAECTDAVCICFVLVFVIKQLKNYLLIL